MLYTRIIPCQKNNTYTKKKKHFCKNKNHKLFQSRYMFGNLNFEYSYRSSIGPGMLRKIRNKGYKYNGW